MTDSLVKRNDHQVDAIFSNLDKGILAYPDHFQFVCSLFFVKVKYAS